MDLFIIMEDLRTSGSIESRVFETIVSLIATSFCMAALHTAYKLDQVSNITQRLAPSLSQNN